MEKKSNDLTGEFFGIHLLINVKNFKRLDTVFDSRQISKHFGKYQSLLINLNKKHGGLLIKNEIDFFETIFVPTEEHPAQEIPFNAIAFAQEVFEKLEEFNRYLNDEYHKNFTQLQRRMLMSRENEKETMPEDASLELQIVINVSNPNSKRYQDKLSRIYIHRKKDFGVYYHGGICLDNRKILRNLEETGIFAGKNLREYLGKIVALYETINVKNSKDYKKIKSFKNL